MADQVERIQEATAELTEAEVKHDEAEAALAVAESVMGHAAGGALTLVRTIRDEGAENSSVDALIDDLEDVADNAGCRIDTLA